jgi:hypothetical protein
VRGAGADGRWALTEAKTAVERTYKFKTFAKAWVSWAEVVWSWSPRLRVCPVVAVVGCDH